jgi:hypothetical protein
MPIVFAVDQEPCPIELTGATLAFIRVPSVRANEPETSLSIDIGISQNIFARV